MSVDEILSREKANVVIDSLAASVVLPKSSPDSCTIHAP